jgi:hypothetical protein
MSKSECPFSLPLFVLCLKIVFKISKMGLQGLGSALPGLNLKEGGGLHRLI